MVLPQLDHQAIYRSFAFNSPDPVVSHACAAGVAGSGYYVSDPDDPSRGIYNASARAAEIPSLLCASDGKNNAMHFEGALAGEAGGWARGNVACNNGQYYYGNGNLGYGTTAHSEGAAPVNGWTDPAFRGVMGVNDHEIGLAGITDGTSATILLGKVRAGVTVSDRRGVWAMGGAGASMMVCYGGVGDDNGPNACNPMKDNVSGRRAVAAHPRVHVYAGTDVEQPGDRPQHAPRRGQRRPGRRQRAFHRRHDRNHRPARQPRREHEHRRGLGLPDNQRRQSEDRGEEAGILKRLAGRRGFADTL